MSKRNRDRRQEEGRPPLASSGNGGAAPSWLPTVLAIVAIVFCAFLWMDAKRAADSLKQVEEKVTVLSTQLASAQANRQQQPAQRPSGPDPAKVYPVSLEGAPTRGKASSPIVIAEFSDYQ
jgi:protein-disulfide isomerase